MFFVRTLWASPSTALLPLCFASTTLSTWFVTSDAPAVSTRSTTAVVAMGATCLRRLLPRRQICSSECVPAAAPVVSALYDAVSFLDFMKKSM
jgi:zona occludens toxin (predicted ATPase)